MLMRLMSVTHRVLPNGSHPNTSSLLAAAGRKFLIFTPAVSQTRLSSNLNASRSDCWYSAQARLGSKWRRLFSGSEVRLPSFRRVNGFFHEMSRSIRPPCRNLWRAKVFRFASAGGLFPWRGNLGNLLRYSPMVVQLSATQFWLQ